MTKTPWLARFPLTTLARSFQLGCQAPGHHFLRLTLIHTPLRSTPPYLPRVHLQYEPLPNPPCLSLQQAKSEIRTPRTLKMKTRKKRLLKKPNNPLRSPEPKGSPNQNQSQDTKRLCQRMKERRKRRGRGRNKQFLIMQSGRPRPCRSSRQRQNPNNPIVMTRRKAQSHGQRQRSQQPRRSKPCFFCMYRYLALYSFPTVKLPHVFF